ncbi:O-methyltransferase [Rhypophila decipiens]|uniref:O-methyltransferase n=1 Tax=Rhypophila decipiens TaxID=261697 RepID=A0AAN7B0M1_9PEZI|nr:O-methyltransferase [Rhypophila decipiens]
MTLESLGSKIAELSALLSQELRDGHHPEPSVSVDGPAAYPAGAEIAESRSKLLDALMEMTQLVTGPKDYWAGITGPLTDFMSLSVLHRFDFFNAIPLQGSASLTEIAQRINLPEQTVARFVRVALSMQLFTIDPPNRIKHTAFSAEVLRTPTMRPFLDFTTSSSFSMLSRGADAIQRYYVGRTEPNDDLGACPFTLTYEEDGSERGLAMWEYFEKRPDQAKRFAGVIQHVNSMGVMNVDAALDLFDWAALGQDVTVVDVGGSSGHVSLYLAQKYPNLNKFVVQDKPALEAVFKDTIPTDLVASGRLEFQSHDFFTPQKIPGDVYLLKSVLHDWPDARAVQILRNLIPALEQASKDGRKPRPRILIVDGVVPTEYDQVSGKPLVPLHVRKNMAGMDMMLFTICNARDRALADWKNIVEKADARFEMVNVASLPGMLLSVMEVVLNLENV